MWNCTKTEIANNTGLNISITFIRHAMTIGNTFNRYIGSTDEDIMREKVVQKLTEESSRMQSEIIFSSPMKRCLSTTAMLFPLRTHDFVVVDELREMDFGVFEGKNHKELDGDEHYQQWIDSGAAIKIQGGESKSEFTKRTMEGFNKMLKLIENHCLNDYCVENNFLQCEEKKDSCNVCAVVHGGTIMAIMSTLFDGDYYDYRTVNLGKAGLIIKKDGRYEGRFL